jgi:hypothetical protein
MKLTRWTSVRDSEVVANQMDKIRLAR